VKFYVEAKKPARDIATADNYFQTARYGWSSSTPLPSCTILNNSRSWTAATVRTLTPASRKTSANTISATTKTRINSRNLLALLPAKPSPGGSLEKFRRKPWPKKTRPGRPTRLLGGALQNIDDAFLEDLGRIRDETRPRFQNAKPKLDGETSPNSPAHMDRPHFPALPRNKTHRTANHIAYFGDKGTAWRISSPNPAARWHLHGIVYKKHEILDAPGFKLDDDSFLRHANGFPNPIRPNDFNAIPIHILGSIYERFLGRSSSPPTNAPGWRKNPKVRKAGGVYYTPE